jgi:mRNA-degrading endonuclease RelE of RelBE toxin-antitoxin system
MKKYTIVADPRVKEDLKEAREFLNARRKGYGKKFLDEYRSFLKTLQTNPAFQVRYNTIHCLPLKTFKYMVHFEINEQNKIVHIYAVLSTYLDPDKNYITKT